MAVIEEIANGSDGILSNLVLEVGQIGLWIQGIGLIIILWLVFQIVALIVNRKRRKALYRIEEKLQRVEKKLDKVLKG